MWVVKIQLASASSQLRRGTSARQLIKLDLCIAAVPVAAVPDEQTKKVWLTV